MGSRRGFWYCPLCGYMFVGNTASGGTRDCPMCGEDALPCRECIRTGVFDATWCTECEDRVQCYALRE